MVNISTLNSTIISSASSAAKEEQQASIRNLVTGQRQDANVADKSVGTGLSIDVSVLNVAEQTAAAAVNLLKTALGAYDTALSNLTQLKNLAVSAANDALSDTERGFLNQEFQTLVSEIDRIADTTEFNGKTLIDGALSGVANVATATSLSTDNQGLIGAESFSLAGTVLSGDLSETASTFGSNLLTFTAGSAGGVSATLTIRQADGTDSESITFNTATTASESAANFVAAAKDAAATGLSSRFFNFVDNGDGSVSVVSNVAGDLVDDIEFGYTQVDAADDIAIGNNGSTTSLNGSNVDFDANQNANTDGTLGTFSTVEAFNVGATKASTELVVTGDGAGTDGTLVLTITDVLGTTEGAAPTNTAVITLTYGAGQADSDVFREDIVYALENYTSQSSGTFNGTTTTNSTAYTIVGNTAILDQLVAERTTVSGTSNDTITISGANAGTDINEFTFNFTGADALGTAGGQAATLGGNAILAAAESIASSTSTLGTNRGVTRAEATTDLNLIGGLSNFSGSFIGGGAGERNQAQLFVEVNGTTYTSNLIDLRGADTTTDANIGDRGDSIRAGTKITFTNPAGAVDTDGNITDNAFVLTVGSTDITLADVSTVAGGQESITTVATAFETQLASTVITQDRSLNFTLEDPTNGDNRISDAVGTILEGLEGFDTTGSNVTDYNKGDVKLITDTYGTAGTAGNVGSFTVDRLNDTISTTIDGETFTAYLNSNTAPTTGGVQAYGTDVAGNANKGSYNSTTKILDLNDGTTTESAKLNFFSSSTTDGRILQVDLGNVSNFTSQIDISTESGETALQDALNSVFGVANNESLSFQIGVSSSNTVGVSLGSAKTTDIFLDTTGSAQVLNISTRDNAITASDILDNAINNVISLIADTNAAVSTFESVTANIQSSKENAQASADLFLATQVDVEVVRQALASVQEQIALNQQTEAIASLENVLSLFR